MKFFWNYIKKYDQYFMLESRMKHRRISRVQTFGRRFYDMKEKNCFFDCYTQTST